MSSIRRAGSIAALLAVSVMIIGIAGCDTRYGASLNRQDDPVVLEGSSLPKLLGTAPRHIVGFSWDGSAWQQIPVQVDERDWVSPGVIYHLPTSSYPKLAGTTTPFKILVFTPPPSSTADYRSYPTYTPPDSDPNLDANDEVSFLANDTGQQAPAEAATPAAVTASTRQAVTATDPLDPSHKGYVYLFHSDTLTGGSAGTTGVNYQFNLTSGDYLSTYKMGTGSLAPNNTWGSNPETSTVATPGYKQSMSDRWLNDGLSINRISGHDGTAVAANGADILDRAERYATGVGCLRTEDTFDGSQDGEGTFIANISGPVRAIRSYMGANSFKYTSETDVYYPNREDSTLNLLGHAGMPGFGVADDLTTGLTGMTYTDPANTALPIDGTPDAFTPITHTTGTGTQPPAWQLVQGPSGSMLTTRILDTSITGLHTTTTYHDQSPAATTPCTGDASEWGRSGVEVSAAPGSVPVTDPTLSATPGTFTSSMYRYFEGPGFMASQAPTLDADVKNPITTAVGN